MLIEDGREVLCMLFACIFYFKVPNTNREGDWGSGVYPETGGKCTLPVSFSV